LIDGLVFIENACKIYRMNTKKVGNVV